MWSRSHGAAEAARGGGRSATRISDGAEVGDLDAGRLWRSAEAVTERRRVRREERIDANRGRFLTPIVKRLWARDDPQSTRGWANKPTAG